MSRDARPLPSPLSRVVFLISLFDSSSTASTTALQTNKTAFNGMRELCGSPSPRLTTGACGFVCCTSERRATFCKASPLNLLFSSLIFFYYTFTKYTKVELS